MKIIICKHHWRLVARNGQILAHSEQYKREGYAHRAGIKVASALYLPYKFVGQKKVYYP